MHDFLLHHGVNPVVFFLDDYPEMEAEYGAKVPVLMLDGRELCHYFLDKSALEAIEKSGSTNCD